METAKLFAEEGAKVVVADCKEDAGNAVVKEIVAPRVAVQPLQGYISNAYQEEPMVKSAVSTYSCAATVNVW